MCKGYQRPYTATLARLAEPLCTKEFLELVEAEEMEVPRVLDMVSFLPNPRGWTQ